MVIPGIFVFVLIVWAFGAALALDGYFDRERLYCKDCQKGFLSRPASIDHMTHDMSCPHCGSDNTFLTKIDFNAHKCEKCGNITRHIWGYNGSFYFIECCICGEKSDMELVECKLI